jgi:hypothetical protein
MAGDTQKVHLNKNLKEINLINTLKKLSQAQRLKPVTQLLGRQRSGGSRFEVSPSKKFARPHLN